MSFSSVGRRFHARDAATENARSPIRRSVLGWKRSPLLQARSEERDGMLVTSVSMQVGDVSMQVGDVSMQVGDVSMQVGDVNSKTKIELFLT